MALLFEIFKKIAIFYNPCVCSVNMLDSACGVFSQGTVTDRAELFWVINDEVKENHSGKDDGSIEDVNISALHWTKFTGELKLILCQQLDPPTI